MIDFARRDLKTVKRFDAGDVLDELRMLAAKLDELFDEFLSIRCECGFSGRGLNAEHETECFALWLDRRLHRIRGDEAITLQHTAFA